MTSSVLRWRDVAHIKSNFSLCGFIRIRGPSDSYLGYEKTGGKAFNQKLF